ncbi:MAG TPA: TIGR01841 family phasin [Thermohalobaculum sp.]|nr:TIGR01841 family phasin [Thermohalobaculum sp.]
MTSQKFPFAFDPDQFKEMFKVPDFQQFFAGIQAPNAELGNVLEAQKKNVAALVEMNKIAIAGYQDVFKRQAALVEAAVAEARDQVNAVQGQPLTLEQAQKNMETMKASVEKALASAKELAELAQKANTSAFDVINARFEEATAEFKAAAEKLNK